MALNFSHRPIFPGLILDDNGGYLVEGILKKNVDAFGKPWYLNPKLDDSFHCGTEKYHRRGSDESVSKDILDLLPSDPFEMDISSTFTAITDWLEDFEADFGGYGSNEVGVSKRDCQSFAGLNFIWNSAVRFQAFQGNMAVNYYGSACNRQGMANGYHPGNGSADVTCPMAIGSVCNLESMNEGYLSEEKVVGSVCNIEEITNRCLEVKGVSNGSCPIGLGSGHNIARKETTGPSALGSVHSMENISTGSGSYSEDKGVKDCSVGYTKNILIHGDAKTHVTGYQTEDWQKGSAEETCLGEDHHLVWGLVIGCLGVQDLLSVESVCRSLRATVKNERHLWTKIHIGHPLNEKINDERLLRLTTRAQGDLQCLSLVGCTSITDDGLKCIVGSNHNLNKLSVPGCTKLTIEGIVSNLKVLKCMDAAGVKHLRIGALYSAGVEEHYEELKALLGIDDNIQQHNMHKPHFYHMQQVYLLHDDDDRALDIEMCPKCEKLRLIYDCTAEGCQRREQACRACRLCIERCIKCGRCIKDGEYEETFCLDWLCSVCKQQKDL